MANTLRGHPWPSSTPRMFSFVGGGIMRCCLITYRKHTRQHQHAHTRQNIDRHTCAQARDLGDQTDAPRHQNCPQSGGGQHDAHAGGAGHLARAGDNRWVQPSDGEREAQQQQQRRGLAFCQHKPKVKHNAPRRHKHHRPARVLGREDERQ